jgi:hypothetical protein
MARQNSGKKPLQATKERPSLGKAGQREGKRTEGRRLRQRIFCTDGNAKEVQRQREAAQPDCEAAGVIPSGLLRKP